MKLKISLEVFFSSIKWIIEKRVFLMSFIFITKLTTKRLENFLSEDDCSKYVVDIL